MTYAFAYTQAAKLQPVVPVSEAQHIRRRLGQLVFPSRLDVEKIPRDKKGRINPYLAAFLEAKILARECPRLEL